MAMGHVTTHARTFVDTAAVRTAVPLMLGLVGPSGGGKTFSALRLAAGIQRVTGGEVYMIDTEARRGLHYAEQFRFRHLEFVAPFGPLDYLAAIEHCVKKGAKVCVIDSASHEHEGPGGVLEMHDQETRKRAAAWDKSEDAVQMGAWGPAKAERRRMINAVLQLPISTIWCFRAKEKLKIIPGKPPKSMGWMPIAGEEFVYEMTARCLLMPSANGVPTWESNEPGEKETMKRPGQFREILADRVQLSEDVGEAMARWAGGGSVSDVATGLLADIAVADDAGLKAIEPRFKAARATLSRADIQAIGAAVTARRAALAAPAPAPAAEEPAPTETPAANEAAREPGDE